MNSKHFSMNSFLETISYFIHDSELIVILFAFAVLAGLGIAAKVISNYLDSRPAKKTKDEEVKDMIVQMGRDKRRRDAELAARMKKMLE